MKIIDFKKHFFNELNSVYPIQELESFYKLLLHHFNFNQIDVALNPSIELSEVQLNFYKIAITKLKEEIPIQYILGKTDFYGLLFNVNNDVLIPRPETEELVEWILNNQKNNSAENLSILDIGTGSGCIAISLKKTLSNSDVYALDISEKALEIAKSNAHFNNVTINFIQSDIINTPDLKHQFDIIVSNPPYVRTSEKEQMKKNVLNNEPLIALFVADENPLIFYEKICQLAQKNLKIGGSLYFEINQFYGKEMIELLKKYNFQNIELRKDFYDVDRMIKAVK